MSNQRRWWGRPRSRVRGAVAAVGTAAALSMGPLAPAPSAHADIDDLFGDLVGDMVSWFSPADVDAGSDVDTALAPALAAGDADPTVPTHATIAIDPLEEHAGTQPVINISVGGGD